MTAQYILNLLQNVMNVVTIMESAKMEPAFAHQVGMANFAAYQDVLIIALIEENVLQKEIIENGNVSVRMNTPEKIVARSKKKIVMIKWITTQVCLIGQIQCCQLCHWLFFTQRLIFDMFDFVTFARIDFTKNLSCTKRCEKLATLSINYVHQLSLSK